MANRKRTHKADGLYYVTPAMLENPRNTACGFARSVIYREAKIPYDWDRIVAYDSHRNTKIPVTIALADKISQETDPRGWFLEVAKIPTRDRLDFEEQLFPDPRNNEDWQQADRRGIRVAMDLLYARAIREGLVRE